MSKLPWSGLALACVLSIAGSLKAQTALEKGFLNPPDEAKPRVWWH